MNTDFTNRVVSRCDIPQRSGVVVVQSGTAGNPDTVAHARRKGVGAVHFLAILPLLDVITGQIQSLWEIQIGQLSLAQTYHALALLVVSAILLSGLRRFPSSYRFVILPVGCLVGSILLSAACVLAEGRLSLETVVAGFQIVYWLVFWLAVFVVCSTARDCRLVLGGIVVAGIYTAFSIAYLYLNRGEDASIYEELVGNAAGLGTAKGLTGILATAGLVGLWLFRSRAKFLGVLTLFACVVGMLLTYQRTGLVGFAVAVAWLTAWYCCTRRGRDKDTRWALWPIVILAIAAVVVLGTIGTADLEKRWEDISDDEKAGSGRMTFWKVAVSHYAQMDVLSQASGIGYTGMAETLERRYGARIHAHSDFLDALLMLGAVGLLAFFAVHIVVLRMIYRSLSNPAAFAAGVAVYLVMLCQGILTGQMLAPSVMSCYLAAITCICLHSRYQARSEISGSAFVVQWQARLPGVGGYRELA